MYFELGELRPPSLPPVGVCPRPRVCVCVPSYLKIPINAKFSGDKSDTHKRLGTDIAIDAIF